MIKLLRCVLSFALATSHLHATTAGTSGPDDIAIADKSGAKAVVVVAADAGPWEKRAGADLAVYIERMTGARPAVVTSCAADAAGLFVGGAALTNSPALKELLAKTAKPDPVLRADAIALKRAGKHVFIAGNHDEAHYYAVAHLLRLWGCRWYMPGEFGECIPQAEVLKVGTLDFAYAPPFEIRNYWLAWNADTNGQDDFLRRNFGNTVNVPSGHALGQYTKDLIPKGGTMFNVPIAEESTAAHVAKQVAAQFGRGEHVMLGLEDGVYESASPRDGELKAGFHDKYFLTPSMTDAFMTFYNNVARTLTKEHPASKAKIGFLAYANITLPPQRAIVAEKPLVAYLAAIDIDPIHGMDDVRSPPKQEYREMMTRWAQVMQGRLAIYDYDQSMLVWRDFPAPTIAAVRQDVRHYRRAGILGISTESRGALATTFLNLHVRLQLYWNPDAAVDALLAEFYDKFYGPSAAPMAKYWSAIHKAWEESIVTEHEHFLAPAVYTPALVAELRTQLEAAEAITKPLTAKPQPSRDEKLYIERMKFTRLTFDVMQHYLAMVAAAAAEADYTSAVAAGDRGLASRLELAKMNPAFTTRVVGVAAETDAGGPAWWPGEVKQYRDLLALTDGTRGRLVKLLPLEWAFRRDANDTGLPSGWAYREVDLTWWQAQPEKGIAAHQRNPGHWEMLRTDLYAQAQGVLTPDHHSFTGHLWYRASVELSAAEAAAGLHVMFPGLFNEGWLYVNGHLIARREQKPVWWINDYKFEWDVDAGPAFKAGANTITLRLHNPHHFGGIFRRPFLYRPAK